MIIPYQTLRKFIFGHQPMICGDNQSRFDDALIQPASVDCPIGAKVYRMRSNVALNEKKPIKEIIAEHCMYEADISKKGFVLERGVSYIMPLSVHLKLSPDYCAKFSPKSSTGRVDVFARVLTDYASHYDETAFGYTGPLYLEITPLSFCVVVIEDMPLTQLRLVEKNTVALSNEALKVLHAKYGMVRDSRGDVLKPDELYIKDDAIFFRVDLSRQIVGFAARREPAQELCLGSVGVYDYRDFFAAILLHNKSNFLTLTPNRFYLLATEERIKIPHECCAEVIAYDPGTSEMRIHYAGFFDNGFGGEAGTNIVLEVRARDIPHTLEHGQLVCKMRFYKTEIPSKLYGADSGSHYVGIGPSLSKHFKDREKVWI